jgi:exonuclease VII large subunit
MMETFEQSLDGRVTHLVRGFAKAFSCPADRLRRLEEILRLTDPQRPLERGYSLTYVKDSPTPLRAASQVTAGEVVVTRLARGGFTSTIEEVNEG